MGFKGSALSEFGFDELPFFYRTIFLSFFFLLVYCWISNVQRVSLNKNGVKLKV